MTEESKIFDELDKQNITKEQSETIKKNRLKFVKLVRACFKFCNKCKSEISKGGEYWERLCPDCKKVYEKLK